MQRLLIILTTIIALMPRIAFAQESKQDSNAIDKAVYYHNIAQNSENIDSVMHFALLSLQHGEKDNYILRASNFYLVGKSLYMQNRSKEALGFSLRALECNLKTGDKSEIAKSYILIAKCYHDLNSRDSIFYYFNLALDIYSQLHDTANLAYTYQSIGSVNVDLGFPQNARKYYLQALRIDSLSGNYLDLAFDYQNVAFIETELGNNQNALKYHNKAVRIFDTTNTSDPYYIYIKYATYLGLVSTYISYATHTNQQKYADSAYIYIKKIGDYFIENGIYSSELYKTIYYARYLSFCNRDREAVKILLESKHYLEEEEGVTMQTQFYHQLSESYEKLGDYKNAIANYKKMHEYSISLTNDSTMNVIAEFKAEQESKIQQAENSRLEADKTKLQTIATALVAGLILATLLVFFIIKALKTKHRANEQLSEVNKKVYRSITYAERIQRAALTPLKEIDRLFPENFVFYQPRDILSGDFYYAAQCGRYNVIVTADCTGHGIPGAFLSILGISALKEFCVTENDAANPGTILDRMRIFVKDTLVSSSGGSIGEGMDMTICSFDTESMQMRYATANQTAFLVRRGEVLKLKGDTMPVGRYVVEKEHFTTFIQPIEKGDMIYCYSDGITDQPGGERVNTHNRELDDIIGRKFSTKSLIDFIRANYYRPPEIQCKLLDKTLTEWRNGRPLIDDMTMVGIKI